MGVSISKFRLANPERKAKRAAKRKKKNPTSLVTLGFTNPHRGTMKKRKKNSTKAAARKRNPITLSKLTAALKKKNGTRKHRRHRNPAMLSKSTDLVKHGAAALVGFVATRQVPQMLLGTKNAGIMGYLATLATAFAAFFAVSKAAGPGAGNAALIGGGMQLTSRLLNEYVSPVGKILSLSGVGDPVAAGLGEIREGYFPIPVTTEPNSLTPILPAALMPRQIAAPVPTSSPAAQAAAMQMSGLASSTKPSRFASRL